MRSEEETVTRTTIGELVEAYVEAAREVLGDGVLADAVAARLIGDLATVAARDPAPAAPAAPLPPQPILRRLPEVDPPFGTTTIELDEPLPEWPPVGVTDVEPLGWARPDMVAPLAEAAFA